MRQKKTFRGFQISNFEYRATSKTQKSRKCSLFLFKTCRRILVFVLFWFGFFLPFLNIEQESARMPEENALKKQILKKVIKSIFQEGFAKQEQIVRKLISANFLIIMDEIRKSQEHNKK